MMTFKGLIDTVCSVSAHDRLVWENGTFVKGAYGPVISPACFLGRNVREQNKATWQAVYDVFKEEYGKERIERTMNNLFMYPSTWETHSVVSYCIRNMVLALREYYQQDIIDAFRMLKFYKQNAAIAEKTVGPLPAPLKTLLNNDQFMAELAKVDNSKDLSMVLWNTLRKKIIQEGHKASIIAGEAPSLRRGGSSGCHLSHLVYSGALSWLGVPGMQAQDLKKRIAMPRQLNTDDAPESREEYFCLLARVLAYCEVPEPGYLIEAQKDSSGCAGYYEVKEKYASGQGMVFNFLKRAHPTMKTGAGEFLPSCFLFRGTSTAFATIDSVPAVLTDVEKVLGLSAFQSGLKHIISLLNNPDYIAPGDEEIVITGHSLGATLTQFLVEWMAEHEGEWATQAKIKKISCYIFNGTGLPEVMTERFAKAMSRPGLTNYHITIFRADGDPANYVGPRMLGHGCPDDGRASITYIFASAVSKDPHCDLLLLRDSRYPLCAMPQRITEQRELNKVLDNTKSIAYRILEFIRLWIARPLIYLLIWPIYQLYLLICGNRARNLQATLPKQYTDSFTTWLERLTASEPSVPIPQVA